MEATIRVEGDVELKQFIDTLPSAYFNKTKTIFQDAVLRAQTLVQTQSFGTGSDQLKKRTGNLARSIRTTVTGGSLATLQGTLYTDSIYAPIHEYGGEIVAKDKYLSVPGGPYLNQPLPANLTPAGVMRQSAKEVFQGGGYIIKSKSGNWIVMSSNGLPMFFLRKKTKIVPRLGMNEAMDKQVDYIIDKLREFRGY